MLRNTATGAVLATTVRVARGLRDRLRGLRGAAALPPGSALVLTPCRQVHMRGMRYPITAVYVDRVGVVLAVRRLTPGQRGPWLRRARAVVELPADPAPAIRVGDRLVWGEGVWPLDILRKTHGPMECGAGPLRTGLPGPRDLAGADARADSADVARLE